jgi:hypothetical protein
VTGNSASCSRRYVGWGNLEVRVHTNNWTDVEEKEPTPWSWVLLEKPPVAQLLKNF